MGSIKKLSVKMSDLRHASNRIISTIIKIFIALFSFLLLKSVILDQVSR